MPRYKIRRTWPLAALLLITTIARGQATETAGITLDQRLDRLAERLEQRRQDHHIPGLAVAVVKDDEVIFSRGFGVRNVETSEPVTEETLFAVGSTSKAFTSSLVGMLVDEGLVHWDDPASKHLPYFQLSISEAADDDVVTLRDLLCHRTGFTRMSLLWAGGVGDRESVLRDAVNAEPYDGFRDGFHYNNVMYLAAGHAAATAAGSDWDTLIAERIFAPLGMTSSNTSVAASQKDPRLSLGYRWDEATASFKHQPMRTLDVIGPAGSINSNVRDMAQWVRFQLGRGEFDGRRLLSEASHAETWNEQISMGPGIGYGLGWMLHEWNGRRLVEHGGNIDGFAAQVALLPEEDLGFVMLANVTATPMQSEAMSIVWESMLEDWTEDAEPEDSNLDFENYIGTYTADFGPFDDEVFTVKVQNGNLAVDVPGQTVFELKLPDDDGLWQFALTDQIKVEFDLDDNGRAVLMYMHQAGMKFELPRQGVEIEPEIDPDLLRKYLGVYHFEEQGHNVTVVLQNNRLALDVPDQMVFELHMPDEEGFRGFRVIPGAAARFNEEDGKVVSLTLRQNGGENLLQRVGDAPDSEALPTVDEVMAMYHRAVNASQRDQLHSIEMTGTVNFVNQGVKGDYRMIAGQGGRFATTMDIGKYGYVKAATDGENGWSDSSFQPFDTMDHQELAALRVQHPIDILLDWHDVFEDVVVVEKRRSDEGAEHFIVKGSIAELPALRLYVNIETGLIDRIDTVAVIKGLGTMPVTIHLEDYRPVGSVLIPFRTVSEEIQTGRTVVQSESAVANPELTDDAFRLTKPVGE